MSNCLPFKDWYLVGFEKGKGNKKYNAILESNRGNKKRRVPFGDKHYQHYRDTTGLGLWSHLDHNDTKRRRQYRERHRNDNLDCYSPGFFSWCYLW